MMILRSPCTSLLPVAVLVMSLTGNAHGFGIAPPAALQPSLVNKISPVRFPLERRCPQFFRCFAHTQISL